MVGVPGKLLHFRVVQYLLKYSGVFSTHSKVSGLCTAVSKADTLSQGSVKASAVADELVGQAEVVGCPSEEVIQGREVYPNFCT